VKFFQLIWLVWCVIRAGLYVNHSQSHITMTLRTYEIRIREIDCRIHLSGNIFHRKLNRDIKYDKSEKWKDFHVDHEVVYTMFDLKFLLLSQTFLYIWGQSKEMCSETLVVCCTNSCVKGFLSINLLLFNHNLPVVTTSKLCEDAIFGNSVWYCVYKIYGLFLWKC